MSPAFDPHYQHMDVVLGHMVHTHIVLHLFSMLGEAEHFVNILHFIPASSLCDLPLRIST